MRPAKPRKWATPEPLDTNTVMAVDVEASQRDRRRERRIGRNTRPG